jgi:uncharacterized RDD family membrane protein YckC
MMYDLQKADFWKRSSAFIFDKILLFVLAVGLAFLFSSVLNIDSYSEQYREKHKEYSESYGVDLTISKEEYDALPESERAIFDAAADAFNNDEVALYATAMIFNLTLITVIFSILIAYAVLEFTIPLFLKNGQTLGKKIFGVGVMRLDGVKVSAPILFIRTILGKYTIEVMVPVMILIGIRFGMFGILGLIIACLVVLTTLLMVIITKTNSPIHDMLASTVTVDMATQLIFDTPEAALEYKQRIHAEMAEKAEY